MGVGIEANDSIRTCKFRLMPLLIILSAASSPPSVDPEPFVGILPDDSLKKRIDLSRVFLDEFPDVPFPFHIEGFAAYESIP